MLNPSNKVDIKIQLDDLAKAHAELAAQIDDVCKWMISEMEGHIFTCY